jgi:uncharacterized lipoprotein YddW (UPF0748 family)
MSLIRMGGSKLLAHARWLALAFLLPALGGFAATYQITSGTPPPPMREFRAAWIPTVGNSCWPSKPGLSTAQQKAELLALLDRAAQLKLNAVIFQVRPACDALYRSDFEPWSEYLTGTQGKAPAPYYDPLEFAVAEAHRRGLQLHAWFNPYRARHKGAISPPAPNHVSRTHPNLVRSYGKYLWLDPGEREVMDYSSRVVLDVVRRYDIDAVHFDDYFYPYPEPGPGGRELEFPDDPSWRRYGVPSGLSREDWRRRNVDQFVEGIARSIKATKPQVQFGLSPFGIWRPKNPPGIEGLDAYDKLYADARKWLREGWCDYLAPQLYWRFEPRTTSFSELLKWWNQQNPKQRHLWPGLNSLKVGEGWSPGEITAQIQFTRQTVSAPGHIHWSESALMNNASLRQALSGDAYRQPALVPRSPWIAATAPPRPAASVVMSNGGALVTWSAAGNGRPFLWVVQSRQFGDWQTQILPGQRSSLALDLKPELIAVSAADRNGNQSAPVMLKLVK